MPPANHAAGPRLAVGRPRVLQVEDETVGRQGEGAGKHPIVAAGDEVKRAPPPRHAQASFLRIMALRRATITTSPC